MGRLPAFAIPAPGSSTSDHPADGHTGAGRDASLSLGDADWTGEGGPAGTSATAGATGRWWSRAAAATTRPGPLSTTTPKTVTKPAARATLRRTRLPIRLTSLPPLSPQGAPALEQPPL